MICFSCTCKSCHCFCLFLFTAFHFGGACTYLSHRVLYERVFVLVTRVSWHLRGSSVYTFSSSYGRTTFKLHKLVMPTMMMIVIMCTFSCVPGGDRKSVV